MPQAGVEGTGHHWYKALFEHCGKAACRPTQVGPLSWQRSAAIFNSKLGAEAPAREAASASARDDLESATNDLALFALNTLGGLNDAATAKLQAKNVDLGWAQGEGMMSYPNWWSSPNKALQMPSLLAMSDALAATHDAADKRAQLRVVLTTRDAASIVASVCDNRNFGREAGGCVDMQRRMTLAF